MFKKAVDSFGFDDCLKAIDYIVSYSKKTTVPIEDKFAFLRKSLFTNLEKFQKRREHDPEPFEAYIKRILL